MEKFDGYDATCIFHSAHHFWMLHFKGNSHRSRNRFLQRLRISLATSSTAVSGSPCTPGFASFRLILLMLFMERKVQPSLVPGLNWYDAKHDTHQLALSHH